MSVKGKKAFEGKGEIGNQKFLLFPHYLQKYFFSELLKYWFSWKSPIWAAQ